MSLISVQIISTSTASDAESRALCDNWGEVVHTVLKRVWWSSLLITPDPGHPGAELRCWASYLDALDTEYLTEIKNNLEVAQEDCVVCCFFATEKVHLCDCSPWEQQRVQRSGTRRARRMRQCQPPPGSWARSRREAASWRARYGKTPATFQIFVNLVTNMIVYTLHLSAFPSSPPLSRSSVRTYRAQCA